MQSSIETEESSDRSGVLSDRSGLLYEHSVLSYDRSGLSSESTGVFPSPTVLCPARLEALSDPIVVVSNGSEQCSGDSEDTPAPIMLSSVPGLG
jgi:hypothetical protein